MSDEEPSITIDKFGGTYANRACPVALVAAAAVGVAARVACRELEVALMARHRVEEFRITATHWRVAGRDYGWPSRCPIPAELWVPLTQAAPAAWLARFLDTSVQEEAHRVLVAERQARARNRSKGVAGV
jgi:hypothetical protein